MPNTKIMLVVIILSSIAWESCSSKKPETLQFDREKIVHFLVDYYTIQSAVTLSDKSKRDSLYKDFTEKYAAQHQISLAEIQKELKTLESYPDSLIVFQNIALDTLRIIQENIIRNNELKQKQLQ